MFRKTFALFVLLCLGSCAAFGGSAPPPARTQLQLRQMQTREFEAVDEKRVLRAMLDVLQDEGFVVKNAVSELGLITAVKEADVESADERFLQLLFNGDDARWKRNSVLEATATVNRHGGERVRVRVTFQLKTLDNRGGVVSIDVLEDESYYQEFFAKVDQGVFIRREGI